MTDQPPVRMPPVRPADYTAEQKEAEAVFVRTRNVPPFGPFSVIMRSPEMLTHVQKLGEFLRYRCSLSGRLSEFVILLVAREWSQSFEWATHAPIALREGVPEAVVQAIADGHKPAGLTAAEDTAYEFFRELVGIKCVSDSTYFRASEHFGEAGIMELAGLIGYYTLLAQVMNVARTLAPGAGPTLRPFP